MALLLGSCLAPIDLATEISEGELVVTGQISTVPEQNVIQLGLTAGTERLPVPLSGAVVTLFDDAGNFHTYMEDPLSLGSYKLEGVTGIPTRSYHIQIRVPSGKVYESIPERISATVGQLTTQYEFVQEEVTDLEGIVSFDPFVKIYANSVWPETSESIYLKWSIEEDFLLSPTDFPDPFGNIPPPCFISQNADPQRIILFDGDDIKATSLETFLVGSRVIDWTFLERHYFTVYQSSLTKEALEYWRKVNILSNQVGSIFDTPPAEITGNIHNINDPSEKVHGYFQATNQTYDRFYLLPSSFPFRLLVTECTMDNRDFNLYPARCLDCLTVRNSSYRRPDWF